MMEPSSKRLLMSSGKWTRLPAAFVANCTSLPEQAEHIRKLVDAEEKAFADKRREVEEEVEQMHDLFFKAQNKQLNTIISFASASRF